MADASSQNGLSPMPGAAGSQLRQERMSVPEAIRLAVTEHRAGRLGQAESIYRQILAVQPQEYPALLNLASVQADAGRPADALETLRQARMIQPGEPRALFTLARILQAQGEVEEAIARYREAMAGMPNYADGWRILGDLLCQVRQLPEAAAALGNGLKADPNHLGCLFELASAQRMMKDLPGATVTMRRFCALNPSAAIGWSNLAALLTEQRQLDEAEAILHQALKLSPELLRAHVNMANILVRRNRLNEAMRWYDSALKIDPHCAAARANRSLILLRRGLWPQAWQEYAWRWKWDEFNCYHLRQRFANEPWDGRELHGRRLLVHAEQGMGDMIHFIRYLPMVKARGAHVILEVLSPLTRLFARASGVDELAEYGKALPPFDKYCPMMDLPGVFGTTLETIPSATPYLTPYPDDTAWWASALASEKRLKVGLCWRGGAQSRNNDLRSMDAKHLAPLLAVEGAAFYALAVDGCKDLAALPPGCIVPLGPNLRDFADTAAAIEQMDLVISVDTAVAHLAGALGKPVIMLLYNLGEWRWLEGREDTPWYPTMRIFRQQREHEWGPVVERAADELRRRLADPARRTSP